MSLNHVTYTNILMHEWAAVYMDARSHVKPDLKISSSSLELGHDHLQDHSEHLATAQSWPLIREQKLQQTNIPNVTFINNSQQISAHAN